MNIAELRKMSATDLEAKLKSSREALMNLRFKHATGQLEKTATLRNTKREVAQILTILQEKKGA